MKTVPFFILFLLLCIFSYAQSPTPLNTDPPPGTVRAMAEWEELDALLISWDDTITSGIINTLREIVRHAKEEVEVFIATPDPDQVTFFLSILDVDTQNVTFIQEPVNSIWVRDFGPSTVYLNDVEDQYFIDWIYNRPRPQDDLLPIAISNNLGIPLYTTTDSITDLVNTGGNYMTDGMGTGFSSKLVLEENGIQNDFGYSNHTEDAIKMIMSAYMGIDEYILMDTLYHDLINHIDMHMKLLDEETLMVGQYPEGISNGPQIEANIQYILNNFQTPFGNPYEIIRIPMPPDFNGFFPNLDNPAENGSPRTYTNAVFINNTILVPTYEEQFDTTAFRIWSEAMPGYKIQGINSNSIIDLQGAIHCITKEIGVAEPLLINHSKVRSACEENDIYFEASVKHHSGIAGVNLFYSTDTTAGYQNISMNFSGDDTWNVTIPATNLVTEMFYYIQAIANNGKQINRPLPAPKAYWSFPVKDCIVSTENLSTEVSLNKIYPNPTNAIAVIPISTTHSINATIELTNILGKKVETIFSGKIPTGESNYFIHANKYPSGSYFATLKTENQIIVQKIIIK